MTKEIDQRSGYCFVAGVPTEKNGKISHAMFTNQGNGQAHYANGCHDLVVKGTSKEVCGHNISDDKSPAKVIIAKNGDIHIECQFGDISLVAKNIRLKASEEITINGAKIVSVKAATVTAHGSVTSIVGENSATVTSTGSVSIFGGTSTDVNDGPSIDESSILGKILNIVKQVKKFFTSVCSDENKPEGGGTGTGVA